MSRLILSILLFTTLRIQAAIIHAGHGNKVNTLSKAIDIAKDGDTIMLANGIYTEGNVLISKPLTLLGSGNTVLDGQSRTELLTISGKNIIVRNIIFRNAGYSALNDFAAIKVINASGVLIEHNTILNAYFAIHVSNTVQCSIRNNRVKGQPKSEQLTGNGIHLWKCSQATIENNHVQGHRDGIYFEFVTGSAIRGNLSEGNIRYGLHFMFSHSDHYIHNTFRNNGAGVAVMYSKKVRMEQNHFEQNWGPSAYGILLKEISDSYIGNNHFTRNTVGIYMEGSSRIGITRNEFRGNGYAVKVQASCDDNNFYSNNFRGNTFDIATNGTMVLNRFNDNYWDKYDGYDINRDGVGDVPYHPVSMYAMIVEQNPVTMLLLRSFMISLLDRAEKAIPSLTPEALVDNKPMIKPNKL